MSWPSTILGSFPVSDFLCNHWQKKHLFLSGAVSRFVSPLSPDELAGLACEPGVEARLVTATNPSTEEPWRFEEGPLEESRFSELGERDWTLLVQDVDKLEPEVGKFLSLVGFLPRWSVDDIMISFAVPGGSVGPHTDRYDVFLLQAQGTRKWSVSSRGEGPLRTDTTMKVLAEFDAEEEFIAKPGDVLYLPPGVAHYGVAEDECLTYSFGFRAPTEADLVSSMADRLLEQAGAEQLKEPLRDAVQQPTRLSARVIEEAAKMVAARFAEAARDAGFLGRYLTQPKPHLKAEAVEGEVTFDDIRQELRAGRCLERNALSRFLFSTSNGQLLLFVDGEEFSFAPERELEAFVERLCEGEAIDVSALAALPLREQLARTLCWLVQAGALVYSSSS